MCESICTTKAFDLQRASSEITNEIKEDMIKREKLVKGWVEDAPTANKKQIAEMRSKVAKHIPETKTGHYFEVLNYKCSL